ncbi:hypothetical protein DH09_03990 [Bacillaceae bacterium JMAK1]|nr:hypothetical protein DH09_03990 [Bacillaceae bacterium JMAK1]
MAKDEVSIPLSPDWTQEEIVAVANFFSVIEQAYDQGVLASEVLSAYKDFKAVIPSKSEEKKTFQEYDEQADTSTWAAIQKAKSVEPDEKVKL